MVATHIRYDICLISNLPTHSRPWSRASFHRAQTITQGKNIEAEENHLKGVLEGNRFPEAIVHSS